MASKSLPGDQPPPSYAEVEAELSGEIVDPATLVLEGPAVYQKNDDGSLTPLYELSRPIHPLPKQQTSVKFGRAGPTASDKTQKDDPQRPDSQRQLFYLVHPQNADYRDDIEAAYYLTSVASDMLGNMYLTTHKAMLQRRSLTAMVCKGRNAHDKPLLHKDNEEVLFTSKPGLVGNQWRWMDSRGQDVAREESNGDERKLAITALLDRRTRDALAALWLLKVWQDVAETRQAKRQGKIYRGNDGD